MRDSGRVLVVAPEWPGRTSGYGLAIESMLDVLVEEWEGVDLCSFSPSAEPAALRPAIRTNWLRPPDLPPIARFILSLPGAYPAVAWRPRAVSSGLADWVEAEGGTASWQAVLLEDLPAAEAWRRAGLVHQRIHLRLHNVLADAFRGLDRRGGAPRRMAWRYERRRIERWERGLVHRHRGNLSTLSEADSLRLADRYGAGSSVVPVAIQVNRYAGLEPGEARTFVHVGSADERKGAGLFDFVDRAWPRIREHRPEVHLLLAGRGTRAFHDPAAGIEGLGFVEDARAVLAQGRIFVNPQTVGSGVKLKSLVAMASGRCLLTYPEGIRGVPARDGRDCAVVSSVDEMVTRAVALVDDPAVTSRIARGGERLVCREFTNESVRAALPASLRP